MYNKFINVSVQENSLDSTGYFSRTRAFYILSYNEHVKPPPFIEIACNFLCEGSPPLPLVPFWLYSHMEVSKVRNWYATSENAVHVATAIGKI